MRHIVTGGCGFVGRHLCEMLVARGERPLVFDIASLPGSLAGRVDHLAGDIARDDLAALRLTPSDVVYHLAARQFSGSVPRRGRETWFDAVNVEGTRRLLAAMVAGGARRLVFFSTDMTYGRPDARPVPATHPQRPIGPYGASKVAAERLIAGCRAAGAIDATIFRPRLIAGAGRLGILARLFALIRLGLPVPLIGSGWNHYQMIAVEDCVAAALRAADLGCPPGPFNLGSDEPPTVRDLLAGLIAQARSRSILLPIPVRLAQATLAGLDRAGATLLYPEQFAIADVDYILDTRATRTALGWSPTCRDADILLAAYTTFIRAKEAGAIERPPRSARSR